jgi:16S rRNA (guanine966-N2)-methyltransferase
VDVGATIAHSIRMGGMRKSTGVRIIAGAFKGRRLAAPPGLETRPLPDRVKQALFDWLGQRLDGLHVADCCAGSGAFAFEALSRGARCVEAIEPGAHALPILRANAAGLGNPAALVLHPRTFQAVLPQLHDLDLIFADPPFPWYAKDRATLAALLQMGARALAPGGRFVIRGERGATLPELPADLVETDRRTYGRSWLAMLERNPVQPGS